MDPGIAFTASSRTLRLCAFAVAFVALGLNPGCRRGTDAVYTSLNESRRLAADLRVQFNREADASNRAVMAETDEASVAAASDAAQITRLVESDAAALGPLLRGLGFANPIRFFDEFEKHFSEYRSLDRSILELAVENTNLKAQRLSFGPAREEADRFRDSLATVAGKDRCRVEGLVGKAILAVREIQILHAPHIAEADDAAMTRIEQEMASREAAARDAVNALLPLTEPAEHAALSTALAALDRFQQVSRQIVTLSRRNTNVRSLDLSLRAKPSLVGACDESVRELQEALANEGFKATR